MSHLTTTAELGNRRFLFITGKGGVGKTTFSAAFATALAAQGKRVLIAMCGVKERLSAILGTPPIGDELVSVGRNIWAVNISAERALREYGEMTIKVKALAHAVFENKYTRTFFRATPGLYEWSMLGKAWFHTTELDASGRNRFDIVLLDAPATGHGLDMLRVPKVILDVVPPGVLRRDAETAWAMFQDPKKSGVVVVTLPEEMPTTETIELIAGIRELGLPVLKLVVNAVLDPLFSPEERAILAADEELLAVDAPAKSANTADGAIVAGARRAVRERIQSEALARLRASLDTIPILELPFLFDEASTVAGTKLLAAKL